ncbi:Hypothetical predicted protein [Pelobates cultripes]|uniref:Uncharacterized protein n=1 Tax=Pelobates cultripes TaxID=61616 RepID=A0AAD1S009_PELCU|nr:Hypothetical predicted protein [Pelobates cultripes]
MRGVRSVRSPQCSENVISPTSGDTHSPYSPDIKRHGPQPEALMKYHDYWRNWEYCLDPSGNHGDVEGDLCRVLLRDDDRNMENLQIEHTSKISARGTLFRAPTASSLEPSPFLSGLIGLDSPILIQQGGLFAGQLGVEGYWEDVPPHAEHPQDALPMR